MVLVWRAKLAASNTSIILIFKLCLATLLNVADFVDNSIPSCVLATLISVAELNIYFFNYRLATLISVAECIIS
jgi:hypothetical protein